MQKNQMQWHQANMSAIRKHKAINAFLYKDLLNDTPLKKNTVEQ